MKFKPFSVDQNWSSAELAEWSELRKKGQTYYAFLYSIPRSTFGFILMCLSLLYFQPYPPLLYIIVAFFALLIYGIGYVVGLNRWSAIDSSYKIQEQKQTGTV
jgi:hypothetical protein